MEKEHMAKEDESELNVLRTKDETLVPHGSLQEHNSPLVGVNSDSVRVTRSSAAHGVISNESIGVKCCWVEKCDSGFEHFLGIKIFNWTSNRFSFEENLWARNPKTAALIAALRKEGCPAPRQEETLFDSDEEEAQEARQEYQAKNRWGYVPKVLTCDGRLQFSHSFDGQPIIKTSNKDHYFNASIGDGSYDTIYLVAIFDGDEEVSV
ncbi:hypothetical protein B0H14DRAFT_2617455 [Mycena olivaceomarginata]|nr:hypothetical protein B0H14DRAFT_2617455 [Mycena olivaceomarginata]